MQFFNGVHINEFKEISKLLLIYHTFYFFSVTKCDLNFKGLDLQPIQHDMSSVYENHCLERYQL